METGMRQIHTYDNSLLNTSSKLTQYYQCDKGQPKPINCKSAGMYHSDTTGFVPSVGGQALQGVAIGAGLGVSDNSTTSKAGGTTVINNECRGNCGGKR
jgi:hypothetical protein